MARMIVKRRQGECLVIGDSVVVEVMKGGRLAVYANKLVPIWRGELDKERLEKIKASEEKQNEGCHGKSKEESGACQRLYSSLGREED